MRYYRVEALCGHVGKGRCIRKEFGVVASNGKEAARVCRTIPRVKHDFKEAILSVKGGVIYRVPCSKKHSGAEKLLLGFGD